MNSKMTRRALVRGGLITGALIPVTGLFINRLAIAAPPALDPSDPTAKALGYVLKSTKPDQQCDNCAQFQGKSGDSQGGCTLFPGKSVASCGWCMTWAKKPAV
jgi:High potential iron-sulfur protein